MNSTSKCVVSLGGGSEMRPLYQREMPHRIYGIRVGYDLFLIPHLTSVFLSFPTCHPFFCIEICEAYLTLHGNSFWGRQVFTMNPGCASLSLWEFPLLLVIDWNYPFYITTKNGNLTLPFFGGNYYIVVLHNIYY